MIRVVFYRADGVIIGVSSEGHAGKRISGFFGAFLQGKEHGNILCAAVSVLLYQLKVDLTMVEGLKPVKETEQKGFFELTLASPDAKRAGNYFKGLLIMLERLALQYKNKIRIITEDIHVT